MQLMAFIGKNRNLIILIGVILVLIPYSIGVYVRNAAKPSQISAPISPSPVITQTVAEPTVTMTLQPTEYPQTKLLNTVHDRPSLTNTDTSVKQNIIAMLPKGDVSGILYQSATISISYVKSADIFQVEILTKEIDSAKNEAVNWFKTKGASIEGICRYPVSFYLNFQIKQELAPQTSPFNPLPPGC